MKQWRGMPEKFSVTLSRGTKQQSWSSVAMDMDQLKGIIKNKYWILCEIVIEYSDKYVADFSQFDPTSIHLFCLEL